MDCLDLLGGVWSSPGLGEGGFERQKEVVREAEREKEGGAALGGGLRADL